MTNQRNQRIDELSPVTEEVVKEALSYIGKCMFTENKREVQLAMENMINTIIVHDNYITFDTVNEKKRIKEFGSMSVMLIVSQLI